MYSIARSSPLEPAPRPSILSSASVRMWLAITSAVTFCAASRSRLDQLGGIETGLARPRKSRARMSFIARHHTRDRVSCGGTSRKGEDLLRGAGRLDGGAAVLGPAVLIVLGALRLLLAVADGLEL